MPQIKAAEKALRASNRRRVVNDRWRRKLRESIKEVRAAIIRQEKQAAQTAFLAAQKIFDRAARHNVIHPNAAARRKSRLTQAIAKLS